MNAAEVVDYLTSGPFIFGISIIFGVLACGWLMHTARRDEVRSMTELELDLAIDYCRRHDEDYSAYTAELKRRARLDGRFRP